MSIECNVPSRTLFIGDNLDVLRGFNSDSIDLIYLDPPFASRQPLASNFNVGVFNDSWAFDQAGFAALDEIEWRAPSVFDVIRNAEAIHGEAMAAYLTFMSVRLLEMERILKPYGSIYLHCDPHSSRFLHLAMDAIFGASQFISQIVWKRTSAHGGARKWGPIHDLILFYSGRKGHRWNRVFQDFPSEYWQKYYRYEDERGKYQLVTLTSAGVRPGAAGSEWRGINPSDVGRHWAVPLRLLQGEYPDRPDLKRLTPQDKLELLEDAGLVHWPANGSIPRYKMYADMVKGFPIQDIITDILPIAGRSRERTGLPYQKPVALLERIIRASSTPGDIVLDPFCGSGATCIAAERLGRGWIGIDISPRVEEVLARRMERELPEEPTWSEPGARVAPVVMHEPPVRTYIEASMEGANDSERVEEIKQGLFESQGGRCNGCRYEMPLHGLRLDRSPPGTHGKGHSRQPQAPWQLLCHYCIAVKAGQSMDYLELQLYRRGILR